MRILAIETSCDETAISELIATGGIRNPRFRVISNAISSQIDIHRPFGGVVPNLAKRAHIENLPLLLKQLRVQCQLSVVDCDLIAVTVGPGLEPALWTGINFAKELAKQYKKPIIGVNHLEGHLYSFLLQKQKKAVISKSEILISKSYQLKAKSFVQFPAVVLSVSGGHTVLLLLKNLSTWKKLGETLDDAVGEAYDKVARLLGLPYPGGPEIERLAKSSKLKATSYIKFPRPMVGQKNYNFSFAGLKTSVLYHLRDNPLTAKSSKLKANTAASFQAAVIDVLTKKAFRAVKESGAKSVILVGGVSANKSLQKAFKNMASDIGIKFFSPEHEYNTDNAAMIGAAAYINISKLKIKNSKFDGCKVIGKIKLEAQGNLSI